MKTTPTIEALKETLLQFEQDVQELIVIELRRINRAITIQELFPLKFPLYVKAIWLDSKENIVLDTPAQEEKETLFCDVILACEMVHWEMYNLLWMLKKI